MSYCPLLTQMTTRTRVVIVSTITILIGWCLSESSLYMALLWMNSAAISQSWSTRGLYVPLALAGAFITLSIIYVAVWKTFGVLLRKLGKP